MDRTHVLVTHTWLLTSVTCIPIIFIYCILLCGMCPILKQGSADGRDITLTASMLLAKVHLWKTKIS